MTIALSTYAYFWQLSDRVSKPLTLVDMVHSAADLGAEAVQICDQPQLETMTSTGLRSIRSAADQRGIVLEVGTKGTEPERLRRHLEIAAELDARLLRTMLAPHGPGQADAKRTLTDVLPDFERASVTIALETYEQVATADLVRLVRSIGSSHLGVCIDPANTVSLLEDPREVVEIAAPFAVNMHVKDFAFSRSDGAIGFVLAGAPLGEGLLDYAHMLRHIRPSERGITQVVEHWLPWQGSEQATVEMELAWSRRSLAVMSGS